MDLLDAPPSGAMSAMRDPQDLSWLERVATNANIPAEKLSTIIDAYERMLKMQAESAFYSSFSDMQAAMPTVSKTGKSLNGPYAPLEEIIETVRPVLKKFGFAVTHKTTTPAAGRVIVTGFLIHRQGHAITTDFDAGPDKSGNKNEIQAQGSARTYGRRYTTQELLFLATKDDNGRTSAPAKATDEPVLDKPAGYDEWFLDLTAAADLGRAALDKMWDVSKGQHKNYLNKTDLPTWVAMKQRAAKVRPTK